MADTNPSVNRTRLRQLLVKHFDADELRTLCVDLDTHYDRLPGGGLEGKARELIDYLARRGRLPELIALCRDQRPDAAWPEVAIERPAHEDPETVARYLEVVHERCCRAETRPYRQLSELRGAPARLELLQDTGQAGVYVPLRFDLHLSRGGASPPQSPPQAGGRKERSPQGPAGGTPEGTEGGIERDLSRTNVDLQEVLAAPGHLALIGDAGSGKTTVLHLVGAVLATQDRALIDDWLGPVGAHAHRNGGRAPVHNGRAPVPDDRAPLPIPVYLALRDYEHACLTTPHAYGRDVEGLLHFLDDHMQRWHPGCTPPGFLAGLVRAGRAWLLLDALDEVADFDHRLAVRQIIEHLADTYAGNRLLVTARVAAYERGNTRLDERFHTVALRDLTREQWRPMVEGLYAGLEADPGVAAERAHRLVARIDDKPLLQAMVKTPLMVWTATLIHYADRELPEQRAELYHAYVDVLLGERLHEQESAEAAQRLRGERWPAEDRRLYLTYAAYRAHLREEGGEEGRRRDALTVIDERDLVRDILAPYMGEYLGLEGRAAAREASAFLARMAERSGLLYARGGGYTFGDHLTVQEFLVANYLADNVRRTAEWTPFLAERAGQTWWREVLMLVGGYLLQWPEQARRFLLHELGNLPGEGEARASGLAWAGQALLEIPPQRVGWHEVARDTLARRLVGVLWQNPPQASVPARVEAGEVLGRLGDPRFQGPLGLPEFIAIPGGRFWMGSDEEEAGGQTDELPRHPVELSPYALARYPATNAMYARFLEAGGYGDERWWGEARAAGAWQREGRVKDLFGDVRDRPAYWDDERLNGPNQPVAGVTWYEAAAYCRWLTAALDDGHTYRLPSEAEWERAARGEPPPQPSPVHPTGEGGVKASPLRAGGTSDRFGRRGGAIQRYPWGEAWQAGRANTKELGLERPTPVGIFADGASPEGLLNMAGNVWEWCADWYGEDTYRLRAGRVERDPAGPPAGGVKVLRGGSCYEGRDTVRCGLRSWANPGIWLDDYGFRVARGSHLPAP